MMLGEFLYFAGKVCGDAKASRLAKKHHESNDKGKN